MCLLFHRQSVTTTTTAPVPTSLLDPDDRRAMLDAVVHVFFAEVPRRQSLIVKVRASRVSPQREREGRVSD